MKFTFFRWQKKVFIDRTEKFVLVPAGRRVGKTQGAAAACITRALQGKKNLWVDTTHANIDRYFERYFLPILKGHNIAYTWNTQKKLLKLSTGGYVDFRSADRPENIEGFGYHYIWLNEAGIILQNDYLYTNAILPMMLDFPDSQLIAFGTPKGKINKHGDPHKYWSLWQNVEKGLPNYYGKKISSYYNPELSEDNIRELEEEIRKENPDIIPQELYGEFIEQAEGSLFNSNEFNFFNLNEYKAENNKYKFGYIDVASGGLDSTCYVYCEVNDSTGNVYITDVVMSNKDSDYTIPACAELTNRKKPQYTQVETNNAGKMFLAQLRRLCKSTGFIGIHNSTAKETRIISNSWFVKKYVYFRNDYKAGSDYDRFMKEIYSFNKDKKKNKHDDAPDALAGLCSFVYETVYKLYS